MSNLDIAACGGVYEIVAAVNACNDNSKQKRDLRIELLVYEKTYSEHNRLLNYGHWFLESVYRLLGADSFLSGKVSPLVLKNPEKAV